MGEIVNLGLNQLYQGTAVLSEKTQNKRGLIVQKNSEFKFIECKNIITQICETIRQLCQKGTKVLFAGKKFTACLEEQNKQLSENHGKLRKDWVTAFKNRREDPQAYQDFHRQLYGGLPDKTHLLVLQHRIRNAPVFLEKAKVEEGTQYITGHYNQDIKQLGNKEKVGLLQKMRGDKRALPKHERGDIKNAIHTLYSTLDQVDHTQLEKDGPEEAIVANCGKMDGLLKCIDNSFRLECNRAVATVKDPANLGKAEFLLAIRTVIFAEEIGGKLLAKRGPSILAAQEALAKVAENLKEEAGKSEPGIARYIERHEKLDGLIKLLQEVQPPRESVQGILTAVEELDKADSPQGLPKSRDELQARVEGLQSTMEKAKSRSAEIVLAMHEGNQAYQAFQGEIGIEENAIAADEQALVRQLKAFMKNNDLDAKAVFTQAYIQSLAQQVATGEGSTAELAQAKQKLARYNKEAGSANSILLKAQLAAHLAKAGFTDNSSQITIKEFDKHMQGLVKQVEMRVPGAQDKLNAMMSASVVRDHLQLWAQVSKLQRQASQLAETSSQAKGFIGQIDQVMERRMVNETKGASSEAMKTENQSLAEEWRAQNVLKHESKEELKEAQGLLQRLDALSPVTEEAAA